MEKNNLKKAFKGRGLAFIKTKSKIRNWYFPYKNKQFWFKFWKTELYFKIQLVIIRNAKFCILLVPFALLLIPSNYTISVFLGNVFTVKLHFLLLLFQHTKLLHLAFFCYAFQGSLNTNNQKMIWATLWKQFHLNIFWPNVRCNWNQIQKYFKSFFTMP